MSWPALGEVTAGQFTGVRCAFVFELPRSLLEEGAVEFSFRSDDLVVAARYKSLLQMFLRAAQTVSVKTNMPLLVEMLEESDDAQQARTRRLQKSFAESLAVDNGGVPDPRETVGYRFWFLVDSPHYKTKFVNEFGARRTPEYLKQVAVYSGRERLLERAVMNNCLNTKLDSGDNELNVENVFLASVLFKCPAILDAATYFYSAENYGSAVTGADSTKRLVFPNPAVVIPVPSFVDYNTLLSYLLPDYQRDVLRGAVHTLTAGLFGSSQRAPADAAFIRAHVDERKRIEAQLANEFIGIFASKVDLPDANDAFEKIRGLFQDVVSLPLTNPRRIEREKRCLLEYRKRCMGIRSLVSRSMRAINAHMINAEKATHVDWKTIDLKLSVFGNAVVRDFNNIDVMLQAVRSRLLVLDSRVLLLDPFRVLDGLRYSMLIMGEGDKSKSFVLDCLQQTAVPGTVSERDEKTKGSFTSGRTVVDAVEVVDEAEKYLKEYAVQLKKLMTKEQRTTETYHDAEKETILRCSRLCVSNPVTIDPALKSRFVKREPEEVSERCAEKPADSERVVYIAEMRERQCVHAHVEKLIFGGLLPAPTLAVFEKFQARFEDVLRLELGFDAQFRPMQKVRPYVRHWVIATALHRLFYGGEPRFRDGYVDVGQLTFAASYLHDSFDIVWFAVTRHRDQFALESAWHAAKPFRDVLLKASGVRPQLEPDGLYVAIESEVAMSDSAADLEVFPCKQLNQDWSAVRAWDEPRCRRKSYYYDNNRYYLLYTLVDRRDPFDIALDLCRDPLAPYPKTLVRGESAVESMRILTRTEWSAAPTTQPYRAADKDIALDDYASQECLRKLGLQASLVPASVVGDSVLAGADWVGDAWLSSETAADGGNNSGALRSSVGLHVTVAPDASRRAG
jgi:hypothetical protein